MGVYIYRLEPNLYNHPIYGEVGVLAYWDKLAWADFQEVKAQEKRIAIHNEKWKNRLPKFVVFRYNKTQKISATDTVYDFSDYPYAVWYDTENLPTASPPVM